MLPLLLTTILLLVTRVAGQSCEGRCDEPFNGAEPCQCNTACGSHNDCCADYPTICQDAQDSCKGKCGAAYDPALPCECNDKCSQYGNCCPDYDAECEGGGGGGLTDDDLLELGELLVVEDEDNVAGQYVLNTQCTTHNGDPEDCSPFPMFESVEPAVLEIPVYVKIAALYDNYDKNPAIPEDPTPQEVEEQRAFMDEVMESKVMKTAYDYIVAKGAYNGTYQDWSELVYNLWFGQYGRFRGNPGSSGFEHVFIGEIKKGEVSGFHNWFHWYMLEAAGHINYLGYWEHVTFGGWGDGLSFTYTWDGVQKPYGSAFIGTSPSLELALYTICLLNRGDGKCHVRLGGQDVYIQTWEMHYNQQLFVGSAYPDWAL